MIKITFYSTRQTMKGKEKMKVTWEVEDGYVGKRSPQYIEIPDDELEGCDTDEDKQRLIEDYIQEDFDCKISWNIINRS